MKETGGKLRDGMTRTQLKDPYEQNYMFVVGFFSMHSFPGWQKDLAT